MCRLSGIKDKLRELAAAPSAAPSTAVVTPMRGVSMNSLSVRNSPDVQRLINLPRRPAFQTLSEEEIHFLVETYTEKYRRPGGQMKLLPIQAFALREIEETGGLLGPIAVGGGKTLISLLGAVALGVERPLLLVKATLLEKLWKGDYPRLVEHWKIPYLAGHGIRYPDQTLELNVLAYEALSSPKNPNVLFELNPDGVLADEAHTLAPKARSTRRDRFRTFLKEHPTTRFVALSGTLLSKSVRDGAKLSWFALRDGSPFPTTYPVLEEVAGAVDFVTQGVALNPGALSALCDPDEDVRNAFRRRVIETPGVAATSESKLGISLVIHSRVPKLPDAVAKALITLRQQWIRPDGSEITSDLEFYSLAKQLACGFYYRPKWDDSVGAHDRREWSEAHKAFSREVRSFLNYANRTEVDSESLYERAILTGGIQSVAYPRWCAIRDAVPAPTKETVWVSDFLARDAVEFCQKHPTVIWASHDAFAEKIAELGEYDLYAGGKADAAAILQLTGKKTVVMKVKAHLEGKDLTMYQRMLITNASSSGWTWEQLLGRSHREGQRADEVEAYVYTHTPETQQAVVSALNNARWMKQLNGDQRLLQATITFL
jgi:hypothetical protein